MLDGLRDIDWSKLTHAYGAADDVPELLEKLLSTDEKTIRETLSDLYGNILHQGTIYEATAYAVPFLLTIVQQAPLQLTRDQVLYLMGDIADGWGIDETADETVHAALKQGMPLYLGWLRAADNPDRVLAAARILAAFPEDATINAAALKEVIAATSDVMLAIHLVFILRALFSIVTDPTLTSSYLPFIQPYLTHREPLMRLVAAQVHILGAGAFSENIALETLSDALVNPAAYDTAVNFIDHSPLDLLLETFADLPASRSTPYLLKCLTALPEGDTAHEVGYFLLQQVFGLDNGQVMRSYMYAPSRFNYSFPVNAPKPQDRLTLTSDQRAIVTALVACDAFWSVKSNVFEIFGLPATRDELRAFLADTKPN